MKAHWLFLLTHAGCAIVAGAATAAVTLLGLTHWASSVALLAVAVVAMIASWNLATRLRQGLLAVQKATATGEECREISSGIWELDQAVRRVCEYAQRWAEVTTSSQQQTRAVEALLAQLDRRSTREIESRSGMAAHHLRQLLGRITLGIDTGLSQILNSSAEIAECTQEIANSAEDQSDALAKTASYVEQMSVDIDAVSRGADSALTSVSAVRKSARDTLETSQALVLSIDRIRSQVEATERRIRGLGDRWKEISSIVETIAAISSRTDLLALNASIESIRAGEHGRGFAVVAEEVRKLAEQAAQATREITGLLESAQLETNESVTVMARERVELEEETQRVVTTGEALEGIIQLGEESASRVGEISHAAGRQLQLARDLVLAVERISNAAKIGRGRAEKTSWTAKALSDSTRQVDATLVPLRSCTQTLGGGGNGRSASAARLASEPIPPTEPDEMDPARIPSDTERWTNSVCETVEAG